MGICASANKVGELPSEKRVNLLIKKANKQLDLSFDGSADGTALMEVPAKIWRVPAFQADLHILLLKNNNLTVLPDAIGTLKGLRQLDISENNLESLPATIGDCANLEDLDVSENSLASFPPELGKLTKLWRLIVFKNQLRTLPEELGDCESLKEVQLNFFVDWRYLTMS